MKRYDFESFDDFDESGVAGYREAVTVIHENGWIKADLVTECKSWKTALKRFFKSVPELKESWYECIVECIESGYWKANDYKLADGTRNPIPGWAWEVECMDDGLWYVYVGENQADCSSEQPANEEESAESVAETSEEKKDEGVKMGNAIVLKSNAAKNLEQLIDTAECSQSLEFYHGVINASQKKGFLLYGERESLIERLEKRRSEIEKPAQLPQQVISESGLYCYTPEMGQAKPECQIEASRSYDGRHYHLYTPLGLRGRGISFGAVCSANNFVGDDDYRIGWNKYLVTEKAFEKLQKQYSICMEVFLD